MAIPVGTTVETIDEQGGFYAAVLAPQAGERVLDAGCGRGRLLEVGVRQQPEARWVGLDAGPSFLRTARQSLGPAVALVAGDLRWSPIASGAFDAVVSRDTLECLPDPAEGIEEMARVLEPGGRLLVCHWDWYTQVFNVRELELSRRLVTAFAETQQGWMECFDPAMGRKLKGLVAGCRALEAVRAGAVTLVESQWSEGKFGFEQSRAMASLLTSRGKLSPEEAEAWLAGCAEAQATGSYLYSITHYWVLARKPA